MKKKVEDAQWRRVEELKNFTSCLESFSQLSLRKWVYKLSKKLKFEEMNFEFEEMNFEFEEMSFEFEEMSLWKLFEKLKFEEMSLEAIWEADQVADRESDDSSWCNYS